MFPHLYLQPHTSAEQLSLQLLYIVFFCVIYNWGSVSAPKDSSVLQAGGVHPCTTVAFGRELRYWGVHGPWSNSKGKSTSSCSCFEKGVGLQVEQEVPYYLNHSESMMHYKEIQHKRQEGGHPAEWSLHKISYLLYCWVTITVYT